MGEKNRFPRSGQESSDQEESKLLHDDEVLSADEHFEVTGRVDEQASALYQTMMAFLDLPDQEEAPLPIGGFFQLEYEEPVKDEPRASEERTLEVYAPVRERSTSDDFSRPGNGSAAIPDDGFDAHTEKVVQFSKIRPQLVSLCEALVSLDSVEDVRKEQSATASLDGEDESVRLSLSKSGSPEQFESRPSRPVESVPDLNPAALYPTVPDRIIRFSSLKAELSSQPRPFQSQDHSLPREGEHVFKTEYERGADNPGSVPMAGEYSSSYGDVPVPIFMERDTFHPSGHSSEGVKRAQEASELYQTAVEFLKDTFADVSAGRPISIDRACSIILDIANSPVTRDEWSKTIDEISYPVDSKDFLLFHHASVAIFTICLGITLQLSKEELCRIGAIGFLHDVGKILVPDEILFKRGQLTSEEWKVLKQYPYESYKILSTLGPQYDVLAQCALQVNERIDGSGSPRGLKGDTIHIYAQMIGLMDVYEAMTSNRPYRPKLMHYDAVKEILKTRKASFSRTYITALLRTFSIFPLLSCVKLNSGVIGRIIEVNKELPMRPRIEIIYDAGNVRLPIPFVVDLATQSFLYIEEPIPENKLPVT